MKKVLSILLSFTLIMTCTLSFDTLASNDATPTIIRRDVPTNFEMSNEIDDIKYYTSNKHESRKNNCKKFLHFENLLFDIIY